MFSNNTIFVKNTRALKNQFATIETCKYIGNFQPLFVKFEKAIRNSRFPTFIELVKIG